MLAGWAVPGPAGVAGAAVAARADVADAVEPSATVPAVAALLVRNWRLSTGNLLVH
jgi:hypothetical protein